MYTLFATLILLPVLLGAASGQADKSQDKAPPPCRVSGRVVSALDGAPLKSSRVALVQEETKSHPKVFAATTDSDGHFDIKNVIAGRYQFFAQHVGYVDQQYRAKGTGEGAVLALQPGQEITDVLFRLIRAGVITGRIVDENGEPMAKILVSALRQPTAEEEEDEGKHRSHKERLRPEARTITDDRGEYRLYGLKPGDYYISASMSGAEMYLRVMAGDVFLEQALCSEYVPLYYPGVVAFDQAQPVAVRAGDEIAADFTMRRVPGVEVAGKVIGPDGKPAVNASITIESSQGGAGLPDDLRAQIDKGEFSFKNVPPGSYVIIARQYDEGKTWQARQRIEVGERKVNSLVLALGKGITISGHISFVGPGSPPSANRIYVYLSPTEESVDSTGGFARVGKDGSFQVLDISDGSYAVRVGISEGGWYAKSIRFGADDVLEKGLQIEAGSSGAPLEIVMSSATAQLEGSVIEDDKAVVAAQVRLRPDPETPYNESRGREATTDQNGHFSITDLAPGKYRVTAKLTAEPGLPAPKSEAQAVTLHEGDRQSVQLTPEEPKGQ